MKMTLKTYLDFADDLELVTNRKVLSQGILMWNMKAVTLTIQKIKCKSFADGQTNRCILLEHEWILCV